MENWYNIEVQMLGECERTEKLDLEIADAFGFSELNIDERELYKLVAIFKSDLDFSELRERVYRLLKSHPEIFYVDILHRAFNAFVPVRVTMWQDGKMQNYQTHIMYVEEEY